MYYQWERRNVSFHRIRVLKYHLQRKYVINSQLCFYSNWHSLLFNCCRNMSSHKNVFFVSISVWLGSLCMSVSLLLSPITIGICRKKSTRLTAVIGGLVIALGCLFTSFANQFHQMYFSLGIMLGNIENYFR